MRPGLYIDASCSAKDELYISLKTIAVTGSFEIEAFAATCDVEKISSKWLRVAPGKELPFEFQVGAFGNGYANGGARVHIAVGIHSRLVLSVQMESSFRAYGSRTVADSAIFHAETEYVLLDNFFSEVSSIAMNSQGRAILYFSE